MRFRVILASFISCLITAMFFGIYRKASKYAFSFNISGGSGLKRSLASLAERKLGSIKDFLTTHRKKHVMTRTEIITAIENNRYVYAYTKHGCELVLQADSTELFLSASGWVRWSKAQGIKFRMLSQRSIKFTVEDLTLATEDSALSVEYAEGASDYMETFLGPSGDDGYWEYED